MMELPHLTNYLRTFSDVAAPWAGNYSYDPEALIKKRKESREIHAKSFSLDKVREYFQICSSCSPSEVKESVSKLINIAKDLVGSDATPLVIEGSVIFLFDVFRNCAVIGNKQSLQLRRMFGSFSPSLASKAFHLIQKLIDSLNDDTKEDFVASGFPLNNMGLMEDEFGCKIKFNDHTQLDKSFYSVPLFDRSQFQEKQKSFNGLSFKFNDTAPAKEEPKTITNKSHNATIKYDQQWLTSTLEKSLANSSGNLSPAELALSVCQLLKSTKSNDELQNELFDLLGYERFEMIQTIFKHRNDLTCAKVIEGKETLNDKRPSYSTQVIVQVSNFTYNVLLVIRMCLLLFFNLMFYFLSNIIALDSS